MLKSCLQNGGGGARGSCHQSVLGGTGKRGYPLLPFFGEGFDKEKNPISFILQASIFDHIKLELNRSIVLSPCQQWDGRGFGMKPARGPAV